MKKIVVFAAIFVAVTSLATAEIGLAVGAKGVAGFPAGTTLESKLGSGEKMVPTVNGGGAVFIRYELPLALPLDSKLGVQVDVGFNANNGVAIEYEIPILGKFKEINSFNTVDIPLLVTYRLPVLGLLDVRVGVGPNFGIVLGKVKRDEYLNGTKQATGEDDVASKLLIGLLADVGVGFNLGPGALLVDVRFLNDFTKLATGDKNNKSDVLTRRNLSLSVGYEMRF